MDYVLLGCAALGFFLVGGALAYYLYRNPIKLVGLGTKLFQAVWPYLLAFVLKRMTPEEEAKWRHEQLSGVKPPPKGTGVTTTKPALTETPRRDK